MSLLPRPFSLVALCLAAALRGAGAHAQVAITGTAVNLTHPGTSGAQPGDTVKYSFTFSNPGTTTANNLQVVVGFPTDSATYAQYAAPNVQFSAGGTATVVSDPTTGAYVNAVQWDVGALGAGAQGAAPRYVILHVPPSTPAPSTITLPLYYVQSTSGEPANPAYGDRNALSLSVTAGTPPPATTPSTFAAPTNLGDGSQFTIKVVSSVTTPLLDANGVDSGADTVAPLVLDGSGNPAIVALDQSGKNIHIRIAKADHSATFTTLDVPTTGLPYDLAVADVDGDGQPDLLTVENGSIMLYRNTRDPATPGSLSFAAPIAFTATDSSATQITFNCVAVADVNHDGHLDLIAAGHKANPAGGNGSYGYTLEVAVFTQTSTAGQFSAPVVYYARGTSDFIKTANLTRNLQDADGLPVIDPFPEIVVGSNNGDGTANGSGYGSVTVFINKGDGTFGSLTDADQTFAPKETSIYLHFHALALGDITHDGNRDLVYEASNTTGGFTGVEVVAGAGDGTFTTSGGSQTYGDSVPAFSPHPGAIALADINGDGYLDIAATDPLNTRRIVILTVGAAEIAKNEYFHDSQNPDFAKSNVIQIPTGSTSSNGAVSLDVTDVNADTKPDLAVANYDPADPFTLILNTTGDATTGGGNQDKKVVFDSIAYPGTQGRIVSVLVDRGTRSTGQVVVPFSLGGTAIEANPAKKGFFDYSIVTPAGVSPLSHALTFPAGVNQQVIQIRIAAQKAPQPIKTLTLTLGTPEGDATLGSPETQTAIVTIVDPLQAQLRAATLTVAPGGVDKHTPGVGRTHADWVFTAKEPFPAGTTGKSVLVQAAVLDNSTMPQWQTVLTLQPSQADKTGAVFTGSTIAPPPGNHVQFRTCAIADGYPPKYSLPSASYKIIEGPDVGLYVSQANSEANQTFAQYDIPTTPGGPIVYRMHIANVGGADATNVVVTAPIPHGTTYLPGSATYGSFTGFSPGAIVPVTAKGVVTSVQFKIPTLPQGAAGDLQLEVTVAPLTAFTSSKDPEKAYGKLITATGFNITAAEGINHGDDNDVQHTSLVAVLSGPIQVALTSDHHNGSVNGGDLITYTLTATNSSTTQVNDGVITDVIPAGTVLETAYTQDANGNSTNTILPNPNFNTNPQVAYVVLSNPKTVTGALALAHLPLTGILKKGAVLDLSELDSPTLKSLLASGDVAQEIVWKLPSIPAFTPGTGGNPGFVTVHFTVRVPYDIPATVTQKDGSVAPAQIVNNNYNFTIPGLQPGDPDISALYGQPAPSEDVAVTSTPDASPTIGLSKFAVGEQELNNPGFHGNGYEYTASFGDATTAVQHHGFDYELYYVNDHSSKATAHHVILHDVIPPGTRLRGYFKQNVNGQGDGEMSLEQFTFYDKNGAVIPVTDVSADPSNLLNVAAMDIRLSAIDNLSPLAPGNFGTIRYTVEVDAAPGPKPIVSYGGYNPSLRLNDPSQGTYITTSDLEIPEPARPEILPVIVKGDLAWANPEYTKGVSFALPGDTVPFTVTITNNGDIPGANTHVTTTIPKGSTLLNAGNFVPVYTDGGGGAPSVNATKSPLSLDFGLGVIQAHSSRTFKFFLQVNSLNGHLDPALAASKHLVISKPVVTGAPVLPSHMAAFGKALVSSSAAPTSAMATQDQPVTLADARPPMLGLQRAAPYTVDKNGVFTYTISFSNHGDQAAQNVVIAMQVPYGTYYASASGDGVAAPGTYTVFTPGFAGAAGNNAPTVVPSPTFKERTNPGIIKSTGGGHDIVTWKIPSLPPGSAGNVALTVHASSLNADFMVRDHSLFISADNAASVVVSSHAIGTWIVGRAFDTSRWDILTAFADPLGIPLTKETAPALQTYVDNLTKDSQVHAMSGVDVLVLGNVKLIPLGHNQVIGIVAAGAGNIVAAGAGNIVAAGAGNLVFQGSASDLSVTNVGDGSTSRTARYLLDNAPQLLSSKLANLIAAGAGNLISQDGASLISNHPEDGGVASAIGPNSASSLQIGGHAALLTGKGNALRTGGDGSSLIGQDGGSVISNDGGSLGVYDAGHTTAGVISNDGGSLISQDGGSLISQDGGSLISQDGGSVVSK